MRLAGKVAIVTGGGSGFGEGVVKAFGGLDILVNNTGVAQPPLPLERMDEEMFGRIANVNMRSIYNGARAVVPHSNPSKQSS